MNNRVLILSGPTHEYFDPVRFIGNSSSGKMGKALAEEAHRRGLTVDFISGPVAEPHLPKTGQPVIRVTSADEMLAAARSKFCVADIILFAAAVADYRPAARSAEKFPKTGNPIQIDLIPTPDIAATLCTAKKPGQKAFGFALQTHDGKARAKEKRISKNLDGIILNTPATLGAENGYFTWIDSSTEENWGLLSKTECAKRIFKKIFD